MANFNEAVLTRKGIGLLAKAQAGQSGIKLTKAASGCGSYEEGESLVEKEALKDQKQEFPIDKLSVQNSTTVSVRFTITNEQATGNLQEGYHVKEVGIFAEDPDEGEILYALATTVEGQWDYMPAYNSLLPTYISVEFYAEVSNAANVTIICNGRFITAEEMEEELEKLRREAEDAHDALKELIPKKTSQLTNDSGYKTTDNDTWKANTKDQEGYVAKGKDNPGKVWGTDDDGNPGWVTPQSGDTLPEGLRTGYVQTGCSVFATCGKNATAEGGGNEASGDYSVASGQLCKATGNESRAGGYKSEATGIQSFAWGGYAKASGMYSISLGHGCKASGQASFAEGEEAKATGGASHAGGSFTTAENIGSLAFGSRNKPMATSNDPSFTHFGGTIKGDVFVLGNGHQVPGGSEYFTSNAFRVTYAGAVYGLSAFNSSGADYAEFIKPWADGNPDNEDRVGYLVTVKDGLLYKADEDDYIAGIISGSPSIIGNADEDYYWRYERDEFNRIIWVDVPEMAPELDGDGNPVIGEDGMPVTVPTGRMIEKGAMKLAEDYDLSKQKDYVERKDRPEWDYVGMIGVLAARDDGTCEPGMFCKCGGGGIATLATERGSDTYMVIERVTDGVVKVILK